MATVHFLYNGKIINFKNNPLKSNSYTMQQNVFKSPIFDYFHAFYELIIYKYQFMQRFH